MTINLKSMGTGQRLAKVGVWRFMTVCAHAALVAVLLGGASTAWAQSGGDGKDDPFTGNLRLVRADLALPGSHPGKHKISRSLSLPSETFNLAVDI
ncbi:MAG: hypothetical protein K2Q17_14500 [Nitrospiraceae bacterium]|jgi:hypothetical protein|uniref:hypothetical protein n=1 Tax=Nitrospira cf. moscoviensis SBR1015 TaxID=96242 RepID=UPI0011200F9F|nr:hypothetical protein [Nitrospira cf. moscoviensis SBR1015]MBY0248870.1 hypothetical protein [Nitrospiraceae bacterium]